MTLEGDDGLSISEMCNAGQAHDDKRLNRGSAWQEFGKWYAKNHADELSSTD